MSADAVWDLSRHFKRPPTLDRAYPATMASITFTSSGAQLIGNMLIAPGPGPHPTVLLLHGFPGNENNFDLAHVLRRAGWNVLIFHYRGAWGSQGALQKPSGKTNLLSQKLLKISRVLYLLCKGRPLRAWFKSFWSEGKPGTSET